jgi:cation diffusion facilitator family transporter
MPDNTSTIMRDGGNRDRIIVRTSIVSIVTNLFLAGFKAAVGFFSHSIAVMLDAVNNLSDSVSSIVTIVGTKLAVKPPDKKHPLGHGRAEYITALVVAVIVLYAGVTSFVESIKKILNPATPDYSAVSLVIIAVAVLTKVLLGTFVIKRGKSAKSGALEASGKDALFDAVLSFSVLVTALVFFFFKISLEAYVGAAISVFIIKSGLEMLSGTIGDILGKRADSAVSKELKKVICEQEGVYGAFDVILNDYGPNRYYASAHVEVSDGMTAAQIDTLTRKVQTRVFEKTGIILTALGIYSHNTSDPAIRDMRKRVTDIVVAHEWALQLHGFYADTEEKTMRFDVVFSFEITPEEGLAIVTKEVQEAFPDYTLSIIADVDITD